MWLKQSYRANCANCSSIFPVARNKVRFAAIVDRCVEPTAAAARNLSPQPAFKLWKETIG